MAITRHLRRADYAGCLARSVERALVLATAVAWLVRFLDAQLTLIVATDNVGHIRHSVGHIPFPFSLGETIVRARWRLFGHVLRLNDDVPARVMMAAYFENPSSAATWRRRPRTTLPLSLHQDLQRIGGWLKNGKTYMYAAM